MKALPAGRGSPRGLGQPETGDAASDGVSPPSEVILSGVRANQNEGREPLRVVTMSLQRDWLKIDFAFHTALLSVAADAQ